MNYGRAFRRRISVESIFRTPRVRADIFGRHFEFHQLREVPAVGAESEPLGNANGMACHLV
jgi:hypothetical protein